jgi:hypothetical protein
LSTCTQRVIQYSCELMLRDAIEAERAERDQDADCARIDAAIELAKKNIAALESRELDPAAAGSARGMIDDWGTGLFPATVSFLTSINRCAAFLLSGVRRRNDAAGQSNVMPMVQPINASRRGNRSVRRQSRLGSLCLHCLRSNRQRSDLSSGGGRSRASAARRASNCALCLAGGAYGDQLSAMCDQELGRWRLARSSNGCPGAAR